VLEHVGDGRRVEPLLTQPSVAPLIGTPCCASTISAVLSSMTWTTSPRPQPSRRSASPRPQHRANVSAQVRVASPSTTAGESSKTTAARST